MASIIKSLFHVFISLATKLFVIYVTHAGVLSQRRLSQVVTLDSPDYPFLHDFVFAWSIIRN